MKQSKGPLVQRVEFLAVQGLHALLRRASPRQLDRWSDRLGRGAARTFRRRTALAVENIRRVFPEKTEAEAQELVRRCWQHFARTTLEFLRTIDEPLDSVAGRFDILGWEHAEQALALDRGAIVITAHLGSWEFALSVISRVDRKVTIVARALDNDLLHEKVLRARQRMDVEFVDRRRAARALIRTLEQRGIVILVADQAVQPREGILVPFLGRPAWTTTAPARLGLKFDAPIVCVFCRPSDGRFTLEIEPQIMPQGTVEELTTRINGVISRQIMRTPELWLWMHDRWKKA